MRAITKLLGKSPFAPLKGHMEKVGLCVDKLTEIIEGIGSLSLQEVEGYAKKLCSLEHEADITKNDIRNHLKGLYLPIDRSQFLEILACQDRIADKAEDIALLLTLSDLEMLDRFSEALNILYYKNLEAVHDAGVIVGEINELLESSFGGIEAEKVKRMVEKISLKEYEADLAKQAFMKMFFDQAEALSTPAFYLWIRLIEEIGQLSHLAESLANRIRMILELK